MIKNGRLIRILAACIVMMLIFSGCSACNQKEIEEDIVYETIPVKTAEPTLPPGVEENEFGEMDFEEPATVEKTAKPADVNNEDINNDDEEDENKPTSTSSPTPSSSAENKPADTTTSYEAYHAMSGEEQRAFMESFDDIEDFFAWYNNAKAEHEAANPDIEITDGNIDLGGL